MPDQLYSEKQLREYYLTLQKELEKSIDVDNQPVPIQNRVRSYLVTLLKGNQKLREIPKVLKDKISRELRFLAVDRELS